MLDGVGPHSLSIVEIYQTDHVFVGRVDVAVVILYRSQFLNQFDCWLSLRTVINFD